jgi:hypothetical protein
MNIITYLVLRITCSVLGYGMLVYAVALLTGQV